MGRCRLQTDNGVRPSARFAFGSAPLSSSASRMIGLPYVADNEKRRDRVIADATAFRAVIEQQAHHLAVLTFHSPCQHGRSIGQRLIEVDVDAGAAFAPPARRPRAQHAWSSAAASSPAALPCLMREHCECR